MNKRIVLFGMGEMGEVAFDLLSNDSDFEVEAFTAHERYVTSGEFLGKPVVPFETLEAEYPNTEFDMFVVMGYTDFNRPRAKVFAEAKQKGYNLINYINSSARVSTSDIGENLFILEGATVQAKVRLHDDLLIGSQVIVGHHTTINSHNYLGSGACLCGSNTIGRFNFIGSNAVITGHVNVGEMNYIGPCTKIFSSAGNSELFIDNATRKSAISAQKGAKLFINSNFD